MFDGENADSFQGSEVVEVRLEGFRSEYTAVADVDLLSVPEKAVFAHVGQKTEFNAVVVPSSVKKPISLLLGENALVVFYRQIQGPMDEVSS